MLNKIIDYSINNRLVILVAAILLLTGGTFIITRMEVDVFPDLNAPTVVIMTEAQGMSPEEVEKTVSFPLETSINGVTGLRRVRSSSSMGLSIVYAEFDWDMDIYDARQMVSERLIAVADQLPAHISKPLLAPQASIMGEIMIVAIQADSTNAMKVRDLADWIIRPRLLSVGGVAQVTIHGGDSKEYQILADPLKMKYYDTSLDELIKVCQQINENANGGFLDQYSQKFLIRGIIRTADTAEIGNVVVKMKENIPVKISDLANVTIGATPKIGDGYYGGEKAIIVTITKQPKVNTIELSEKIVHALNEIQQKLPPDVKIHTDVFEQARFIRISINNVMRALFEGSIFVVIILFVFLMNWRTTIISILAIPISLLTAILVMWKMGFSINTMSLGGMAIAIGSLVDDAIIDVENVYKQLRKNAKLPASKQQSIRSVIFNASVEIRPSILNATFIIIIAFVPLFFLSGMEGRMLKPLGIAFIVSLFASLLTAITLTPVLCSFWLTNPKQLKKHEKGSWLEQKLLRIYEKILHVVLKQKKITISVASILFVATLIILFTFGRNFLPPFNEGSLTINIATQPGIALDESNKIGQEVDKALLSFPEISSLTRRTGRAEFAEHTFDVNISEIDAPFVLKNRSRKEFLKEIRRKLSKIKGIIFEIGQPISHRIDAMLSGSKANIAIKLFGNDLNRMFYFANQIKTNIENVEGIGDLTVQQQVEIPELHIKPKREMLAKYGIPINSFARFIEFAFGGVRVSEVFEKEKNYPLILRFNDKERNTIEAIENTLIDSNNGKIPLHYIADIVSYSGPNTISRENVQRKIVINVNVADRDVSGVVKSIQNIVDEKIKLPENYRLEYGGQFESEQKATRQLLLTSLLAILVIFLILYQEFKSSGLAGIILLNLPLALIGGVIAILITSKVISIPGIIGFITLFGIATRNGILLISRYRNLKNQGMELYDLVVRGSLDRLTPILMTALTAALALIPLAISGEKPGNEIQSPMAQVILGGLLSATLLNLLLIPLTYYLFNLKKQKGGKK